MKSYSPDIIFIDESSIDDAITERIMSKFPHVPYEIVKEKSNGNGSANGNGASISSAKKVLNVKRNRGHFIERCPGTKEFLCCNYFIANLAMNCHFDCTYCFLQNYLNDHSITIFSNIQDFLEEVDDVLDKRAPGQDIRIGTGELADSLAMDELTEFSSYIVPFFNERENVSVEFKTKSNYIKNLLKFEPNGKVIVSWSVNPPNIINAEEHKCSTLDERLYAAQKCAEKGYKIAFHFDPIILHKGWEENYKYLVDRIFSFVRPEDIAVISLGVLRFSQAGKQSIQKRFPKTDIVYEEMVQCQDGKMRYPQPVRTQMYNAITGWIHEHSDRLFTYLCMESTSVWDRVYGEEHRTRKTIVNF